MNQKFRYEKAEIGVCYYPEHWEKSLWEKDLKRMAEHGIKTVRVGEFAWNKIEPKEGKFTFSFFDEFLSLCDTLQMKVIFGTPTATPPAWLTEKYPEVLNARMDGTLLHHGARRHYNYNSPVYQKLCARIVKKIAVAYSGHPSIVGWQIDNELNCETNEFYSESDTLAFRKYLKNKFGTLETLNEALGTTFWNQTYTSWKEIFVPRSTIRDTQNPHLLLEYKRFVSFSALNFARLQAEILRKYAKSHQFITTNGMFGDLDNHTLAGEVLDTYHYDSYPNFAYMAGSPEGGMKDREWVRFLSEVRSVSPHFGIMEQQSGANGWNSGMQAPSPKPGQISLWSMQSVANGADYISYFRWRTSPMGTEIYWHGILDYDDRENRKLNEIHTFAKRLNRFSDVVNEEVFAEYALLRDYDNVFDSELDVWHRGVDEISLQGVFEASQSLHAPYNVLYLRDTTPVEELLRYRVIFYPHAAILTKKRAEILKEYVKRGGILVLGARTGYKDEFGKCPYGRIQPGFLNELVGATVKEFSFVNADGVKSTAFNGEKLDSVNFRETLEITTAKPLARYVGDFWEGEIALTENEYAAGKVYYFGGTFTKGVAEYFMKKLNLAEPFAEFLSAPEEVELERRGNYLFALNYSSEPQKITWKRFVTDTDNGAKTVGDMVLPPFGTKVVNVI